MNEKSDTPESFSVIYFDGVCVLCNTGVDFVMRRDRRRKFRYATLQSERGQALLRNMGLPPDAFDTFILDEDGRRFDKSTAALRISRGMTGLWPLMYVFIAIPRPLRDAAYSWLAKRRYQTLGQRDSCRAPTDDDRHLFLD